MKNFNGVEVNYSDNITNYGNAQDGIFVNNIDNQIGKTMILNLTTKSDGDFDKEYKYHGIEPHNMDKLGDLSQGIEYKKKFLKMKKHLYLSWV